MTTDHWHLGKIAGFVGMAQVFYPSSLPKPPAVVTTNMMMPLVVEPHSQSCNVFSNRNFTYPLKYELDAMDVKDVQYVPIKRVSFLPKLHILNPEKEYYSDEDIVERWFSPVELQSIKRDAKDFSTILRRSTRSKETCLTMAHRKTTLMLKGDLKALVRLSPSTPDQDIVQWCSVDDGRRGLERFSSRDYCCFRRKDVGTTRTKVLAEQTSQREMGIVDDVAIARVARESSRRARSFALFFGEADLQSAKRSQMTPLKVSRDLPERRLPPRKRSRLNLDIAPAAA